MQGRSVLISGAGIAGPTLAYWLSRRGFTPTLIERAPHFREGGYMIDFWGIGFDVADRMGLLPQLFQVGYSFNRIKFVDEKNRVRSEFGGDVLREALGDRFISLLRGDLAKVIFDIVVQKTDVIFDDSIVDVRESPSEVEVAFEKSESRRFDLLAGCDGLHSTVRELVLGPEDRFEKYLGFHAASFVTNDYPHREELTYVSYSAPGRQISRYALRDNRSAFLFVFVRDHPFAKPPHAEEAKAIVRETFARDEWIEIPEILEQMERCDEFYFDSVSQIRMPVWSRGRTVLLGDAAHCPSLLAGEGAGLAMAGAYILAGELQRANGDFSSAFAAYERQYRHFIDRKQQAAERLAASFAPKTRRGLWLRDFVLRCANRFSPIGKWLMHRLVSDRFELPFYPD